MVVNDLDDLIGEYVVVIVCVGGVIVVGKFCCYVFCFWS